jgi:hypothetical protein
MSKLNPIVSGRRAWAALRDLWRLWCSGAGSGPVRRIPANGSSPGADGGCQIVAEQAADAARMGRGYSLEATLFGSERAKLAPLKFLCQFPAEVFFSAIPTRKFRCRAIPQIGSIKFPNYLTRMKLSEMRAINFEPRCDTFGVLSLLAGESRARGAGLTSPVGAVSRFTRSALLWPRGSPATP